MVTKVIVRYINGGQVVCENALYISSDGDEYYYYDVTNKTGNYIPKRVVLRFQVIER